MNGDLLKTGEAARLMGVSRQHVVDLCDQGQLDHVKVGTHRRIRRSDVDRMLNRQSLSAAERKSLWLHLAVIAVLLSDPVGTVDHAKANLAKWQKVHRRDGMGAHWLARWALILDSDLQTIIDTLIDQSSEAREMRQNSPFAGVLSDDVRTKTLQTFQRLNPVNILQ